MFQTYSLYSQYMHMFSDEYVFQLKGSYSSCTLPVVDGLDILCGGLGQLESSTWGEPFGKHSGFPGFEDHDSSTRF